MSSQQPFHEGELEAQRRAGEATEADRNAPMIGSRIMAGALGFLAEQSMAALGSRDRDGRLWSSLVFGPPGFLKPAEDRRSLAIQTRLELRDAGDPLWENLRRNPQVGILVIDLASRRRLRINGHLASNGPDTLLIEVEESFANCPKYIQRREIQISGQISTPQARGGELRGHRIDPEDLGAIRRADTFFVASAHPQRGLDSSHRGGNPGFVEVMDGVTLRIPDYAGNSMFNTLGNLLVDPRAGLALPDFERHEILQMTGRAEAHWGLPAERGDDTGRFWLFRLDELRRAEIPAAIRSRFLDYSPYNPARR